MKLNLFLNETAPYRLGYGSFNNRLAVWNVIVFEFLAWNTFDAIIFLTYGLLAQHRWGSFHLDKSVTKVVIRYDLLLRIRNVNSELPRILFFVFDLGGLHKVSFYPTTMHGGLFQNRHCRSIKRWNRKNLRHPSYYLDFVPSDFLVCIEQFK